MVEEKNKQSKNNSKDSFVCEMCERHQSSHHLNLKKLNSGLGMDLMKLYKVCNDCATSGRWDWKTERDKGDDPLNW